MHIGSSAIRSPKVKCLIIVCSYHHNNTAKIAHVLSEALQGQVKTPEEAKPEELQEYNLIGFGAGIDRGGITGRCLILSTDCRKSMGSQALFSQQAVCRENRK